MQPGCPQPCPEGWEGLVKERAFGLRLEVDWTKRRTSMSCLLFFPIGDVPFACVLGATVGAVWARLLNLPLEGS